MKKVFCAVKCALALCLCLALLAGTACAEDMYVLSSGEWGDMDYGCTLPDGRMVVTGTKTVYEEYSRTGARVLCLNPDLTVSWDVFEVDENGLLSASKAALLPDGTIAVVFDYYTYGEDAYTVKTYTQDGQLTGKRFDAPAGFIPIEATPAWLMVCRWGESEETDETVLVDWDGNELFRYGGIALPGGNGMPVRNTDELVPAGCDKMGNGHGKMMKLDGQTGEVLWETTLDRQRADSADAFLTRGIKTDDGGYAALLEESGPDPENQPYDWDSFLVKFDAEGRVQRINGESFERDNLSAYNMFSYNGKIGVICDPKQGGEDRGSFHPLIFRWFDAEGKELGTTKVNLNLEDFPAVVEYMDWAGHGGNPEPWVTVESVIPAPGGLLALVKCCMGSTDSEGIYHTIADSHETVLIRIPEPGE